MVSMLSLVSSAVVLAIDRLALYEHWSKSLKFLSFLGPRLCRRDRLRHKLRLFLR